MTTMCLKLPRGPLSAATAGPAAMRLIETRETEARTARSRPLRCFTVPPPGHARGEFRDDTPGPAERELQAVNVWCADSCFVAPLHHKGTSGRGAGCHDRSRAELHAAQPCARVGAHPPPSVQHDGPAMRPGLNIFEPELIGRIFDEAKRVLAEHGFEIRGAEM